MERLFRMNPLKKIFGKKESKSSDDVIDKAMNNLKNREIREEETLEYKIEHGKAIGITIGDSGEDNDRFRIDRNSFLTKQEVTRIYIKECLKDYKDFLGDEYDEFEEFMIDQYNEGKGSRVTLKLLKAKFDLPPKEAREVYQKVMKKAIITSNWTIDKDRGANIFTIHCYDDTRYDGQEFPIDSFLEYVDFMVENNGSPRFRKK